jgi:hypothetical protein
MFQSIVSTACHYRQGSVDVNQLGLLKY